MLKMGHHLEGPPQAPFFLTSPGARRAELHFNRPYKLGGRGAEEGSPTHHAALGIPSNDQLCTILDFQGPGEGPWPCHGSQPSCLNAGGF